MKNWWRFFKPVVSITPEEARRIMESEARVSLIDVRQPEEFAQGAVEGAILMPLFETGKRSAELDPASPLLVYCRSGSRSKLAARILAVKGFKDVKNVAGGILAW